MAATTPQSEGHRGRRLRVALMTLALLVFLATGLAAVAPAFAGQAAPGELHFYPCDDCHPVAPDGTPTKPIPNDFDGHDIVLEGHDVLGPENEACAVCHREPYEDPTILNIVASGTVDITGDVALVCYQCHQEKYRAWQNGIHGKHQESCSAAGCHDPHTPGYIYAEPLPPFVGTGFQFKILPETEPFTPLPPPAAAPPTTTPTWFIVLAVLGVVAAGGETLWLVRGRRKR